MKKLYSILAVLAAAALLWLGWQWLDGRRQLPLDEPSVISWMGDPPTKVENEPVKIFQRAFWASPTEDDRILHAERREWRDGDGLQRWQWFLVVKASTQLIKNLRDDNAFGLVPGSAISLNPEAPNWFVFKPAEFSIFQSPHSGMRLMFSKTDNTLYATDSGRGFTKGAPEPFKQAAPSPAPGRLPPTPPLTPKP